MNDERLETEYLILQPCKTSAAWEAFPRKKRKLALSDAAVGLEAAGLEIVHDAGVLLLVKGEIESSVYESGKLLLKTTDKEVALSEAKRIARAIGLVDRA